jgi:polyhydroxyalkanoate synthesis regulator phasin
MDKIEKGEKELTDKIKTEIQKNIKELGLATKKDIDELNKRLKNLEKYF